MATTTDTTEATEKKTRKRRPVYLLIPATWGVHVVTGDDGQDHEIRKPETYKLVVCQTKKEIQDALTDAQIDITNSDEILALRANPTRLRLSTQVILRWGDEDGDGDSES